MTATIHKLADAAKSRETRRQEALNTTMAVTYTGEVVIGDDGLVDVEFAVPWQAQVDALGLKVQVTSLDAYQFVELTKLISIWAFCVQNRLGTDLDNLESSSRNDYLKAVVSGEPHNAKVPDDLQRALDAIVQSPTKREVAAPVRALRLVKVTSDSDAVN
jgi:hypothetical protein